MRTAPAVCQMAHRDIAMEPDGTSRRLPRPPLVHHGPARLFSTAVPPCASQRPRDWVGAGRLSLR